MKIFIAGARSVTHLDESVQKRMYTIYQKGYDVLVGDCYGVDTCVQNYYANLRYNNVMVYATGGRARNNIGNWTIKSITAGANISGFDFYRQKDIAMAKEADYGFMIWDGESKGTLSNIVQLITQNKKVLIYMTKHNQMMVASSTDEFEKILAFCPAKTAALYRKFCPKSPQSEDMQLRLTTT